MRLVPTLLASADRVLDSAKGASPIWLRATSLVYRGAVEAMLDEFWALNTPPMLGVPRRTQLLCLASWIEPALAQELTFTWNELSELAHHRLDSGPDPGRVRRLGEATWGLARALGHVS